MTVIKRMNNQDSCSQQNSKKICYKRIGSVVEDTDISEDYEDSFQKLKEEWAGNSRSKNAMKKLMKVTYASCCHWITQDNPTVAMVLETFPCLVMPKFESSVDIIFAVQFAIVTDCLPC